MKIIFPLLFCFLLTSCGSSSENNTPEKCGGRAFCTIFTTSSTTEGNMGGVIGADVICENDANNPGNGSAYKALISDGVFRVACTSNNCSGGASENVDWVLRPSTEYRRLDNTTIIVNTNASAIFDLDYSSSNLENTIDPSSSSAIVWSGLQFGGTFNNWTNIDIDCSDWTSNLPGDFGTAGQSNSIGAVVFTAANDPCNSLQKVYCVEQ